MSLSERFSAIQKNSKPSKSSSVSKTPASQKKNNRVQAVLNSKPSGPKSERRSQRPSKQVVKANLNGNSRNTTHVRRSQQSSKKPAKGTPAQKDKQSKKPKQPAKMTEADLDAMMDSYTAQNPAYAAAKLDEVLDNYKKERPQPSATPAAEAPAPAST